MPHDSAFSIPTGRRTAQTLIVYVEDQPGTLNRIVSLFRRRGFNIESLTVGRSEREGISRITVDELKGKLDSGEELVIVDLRHSMDFEADPETIPGAFRMDSKELEEKNVAEAVAGRMGNVEIVIARRVGETEALYGSVTTADIAEGLAAKGFEIERRKIQLPEPIKQIGEFDIPVKLHRDLSAKVKVKVVGEGQKT